MSLTSLDAYREAIQTSGTTIYDLPSAPGAVWIPSEPLALLLTRRLRGLDVSGLQNRTKSKEVKSAVCDAMGYPTPSSFQRTTPRFPAQNLEVHVQKSQNLQLYNRPESSQPRIALIEQCADDTLGRIKVLDLGSLLEGQSGMLTSKYQARLAQGSASDSLFSTKTDTPALAPFVSHGIELTAWHTPLSAPLAGELFSMEALEFLLTTLVGAMFPVPGAGQERRRGDALHRLVCEKLGYRAFGDSGAFPDIPHQLLELKLQTANTIDLGATSPDSDELLSGWALSDQPISHQDVRYAVFFAETNGTSVTITRVVVVSGKDFFTKFTRCGGNLVNTKQQIILPADFFETAPQPNSPQEHGLQPLLPKYSTTQLSLF